MLPARIQVWSLLCLAVVAGCGPHRAGEARAKPASRDLGRAVSGRLADVLERSDREGTVPIGCEIVASLDFSSQVGASALRSLQGRLLRAAPSELMGGMAALGIDAFHDFRKALLCKIAARGLADQDMGVAVSGAFPSDLLAKAASGKNTFHSDVVDGIPVLADQRLWIAQRGKDEVVFCTSARLLRSFLTGPVEGFDVGRDTAFFLRMSGASLRAVLAGRRGFQAPEFAPVQRLAIDLTGDGMMLTASALTPDGPAAEKLARAMNDAVGEWRRHTTEAGRAEPEIAVRVGGTEVVVRARLPPGAIESALSSALGAMASNSAILRSR